MVDAGVAATIVGEWLSSGQAEFRGSDEGDKVVDPQLGDLGVFPLGSTTIQTIRGDFFFTPPDKTTGAPPKQQTL